MIKWLKMHAPCEWKGQKKRGRDEKTEGERGRIECFESWRGRDVFSEEDAFHHHREWEKWVEERKETERGESWRCSCFAVLTMSFTCSMEGYIGGKVRCCSVLGCSCLVTSASVMERTVHVHMCWLCFLWGLYCSCFIVWISIKCAVFIDWSWSCVHVLQSQEW